MPPSNLLFNSTGSKLNHIWRYPLMCVWKCDRETVYVMYPHANSLFTQQPEESKPVKRSTRSAAKSASGKMKVSWPSLLIWFLFTPLHRGICRHVFQGGSHGADSCATWRRLTLLGLRKRTVCMNTHKLQCCSYKDLLCWSYDYKSLECHNAIFDGFSKLCQVVHEWRPALLLIMVVIMARTVWQGSKVSKCF